MVIDDELVTVKVRRAPKYAVFMGLGAIIGILVALILTFAFNGSGEESPNTGMVYSQTQVFGFLALIFVVVGIVVGGVVALILDRVMSKRARDVVMDRETAHYAE
ncbi:hypothetical protein ASD65_12090 [Microbacterium sp. Root61]|nr:hypothetical protein ASD65_12090 [Microbacterium sp. Root61]